VTSSLDVALDAICVVFPSPLCTVTIEEVAGGEPEVHFHAGGQGVWVSRMIGVLGKHALLCSPLGGESGFVLRALIEREGIELRPVAVGGANGCYVHDRRGGARDAIVETPSAPLDRHELDDFYGTCLTSSLEAACAVLTGPTRENLVPPSFYKRLAHDLDVNGTLVIADVSGATLTALESGVHALKVSHEELIAAGLASGPALQDLMAGMRKLRSCARNILVSRAEEPALALAEDRFFEVVGPRLDAAEYRGAGDSMTAALAAGLKSGQSFEDALPLAAAAGSLNVTRHGLGSGRLEHIQALAKLVEVRPIPG
jgi:1-phosphofructokinase